MGTQWCVINLHFVTTLVRSIYCHCAMWYGGLQKKFSFALCCQFWNVYLTHWCRVTHICVSELTIIGSDNGLSLGRRQAIIWTNAGILLFGTLGTNFSEILIENRIFSFKKMGLKVSSAKWRPFCLGPNVLINVTYKNTQLLPWCVVSPIKYARRSL